MLAVADSLGDLVGWGFFTSLVGVLAAAWLSARLLGVRRSAGATFLSGVLGWAGGVGLSLVIANSQTNRSAGFTRNVWVFSIVFTMSSAVWMELLAKPGTMARAQSGLSSIPRPLRALRRRTDRARRYAQITRIVARNGLGRFLGLDGSRDDDVPARAGGSTRPPRPPGVRRHVREVGPGALDPVRPAPARGGRRALPPAGQHPARRSRRGPPAARGGARRTRREGVRRVRVGPDRGSVDRPGPPGPAARRRTGDREGAATRCGRERAARHRRAPVVGDRGRGAGAVGARVPRRRPGQRVHRPVAGGARLPQRGPQRGGNRGQPRGRRVRAHPQGVRRAHDVGASW